MEDYERGAIWGSIIALVLIVLVSFYWK